MDQPNSWGKRDISRLFLSEYGQIHRNSQMGLEKFTKISRAPPRSVSAVKLLLLLAVRALSPKYDMPSVRLAVCLSESNPVVSDLSKWGFKNLGFYQP